MGFRISYIVADMPLAELATSIGLTIGLQVSEMPVENALWGTELHSGCAVIWAEDELFPLKREAAIAKASAENEILSVVINETVMASTVMFFKNGQDMGFWHWQGDQPKSAHNPSSHGELPFRLGELIHHAQTSQADDPSVDGMFDVPVELINSECGFRYDMYLKPSETKGFWHLSSGEMQ